MKKYKVFLNIISILLLTLAIGIIGYMAYDYISNYILTKEAEEAVSLFEGQVGKIENEQTNSTVIVDIGNVESTNSSITNTQTNNQGASQTNNTSSYKGLKVVGSIKIPKTKIQYPVVDTITPNAIAVAVTAIYGPGLNQVRKYSSSST